MSDKERDYESERLWTERYLIGSEFMTEIIDELRSHGLKVNDEWNDDPEYLGYSIRARDLNIDPWPYLNSIWVVLEGTESYQDFVLESVKVAFEHNCGVDEHGKPTDLEYFQIDLIPLADPKCQEKTIQTTLDLVDRARIVDQEMRRARSKYEKLIRETDIAAVRKLMDLDERNKRAPA